MAIARRVRHYYGTDTERTATTPQLDSDEIALWMQEDGKALHIWRAGIATPAWGAISQTDALLLEAWTVGLDLSSQSGGH